MNLLNQPLKRLSLKIFKFLVEDCMLVSGKSRVPQTEAGLYFLNYFPWQHEILDPVAFSVLTVMFTQ